jgi:hypothetical protein
MAWIETVRGKVTNLFSGNSQPDFGTGAAPELAKSFRACPSPVRAVGWRKSYNFEAPTITTSQNDITRPQRLDLFFVDPQSIPQISEDRDTDGDTASRLCSC